MLRSVLLRRALNVSCRRLCTNVQYEQGQSPEPNIREYFYFIDHQGQLFMDDTKMKNFTSCHKEQKFLEFFFERLRINETGRFEDSFPYMSRCGRERNYLRCDDRPVVYLDLLHSSVSYKPDKFTYGFAKSDKLKTSFQPDKLYMQPETGRIYYPAIPELGGVGLIKSSIAIALSKHFEWGKGEDQPPTQFTWRSVTYDLTNEVAKLMDKSPQEAKELAESMEESFKSFSQ